MSKYDTVGRENQSELAAGSMPAKFKSLCLPQIPTITFRLDLMLGTDSNPVPNVVVFCLSVSETLAYRTREAQVKHAAPTLLS